MSESMPVVFEPGCQVGPGTTICGPGGVLVRGHGKCIGQCGGDNARQVTRWPNSGYYGPDTYCECGDRYQDGVMTPRPFERGWRKRAQARFTRLWGDPQALPEGTRPLYDRDAWLSGVRLPDGTEVRR